MDRGGIIIGDGTFIGPNVTILTICHDANPNRRYITYCKPVTIEENVWICANAIILPGVKICRGSIIGAGSVVTKDVGENVIVAGNPAKIIKKIDLEESK